MSLISFLEAFYASTSGLRMCCAPRAHMHTATHLSRHAQTYVHISSKCGIHKRACTCMYTCIYTHSTFCKCRSHSSSFVFFKVGHTVRERAGLVDELLVVSDDALGDCLGVTGFFARSTRSLAVTWGSFLGDAPLATERPRPTKPSEPRRHPAETRLGPCTGNLRSTESYKEPLEKTGLAERVDLAGEASALNPQPDVHLRG